MKTKIYVAICLVAALAACSGAKFAEEKTLLTGMATAMETFSEAVQSADTPDGITQALTGLTDKLAETLPAMKKLTDAHPEWEENPPEELGDVMAKFKGASEGLMGSMVKVMSMAQDHADNAELQSAVEKFTGLMQQL